MAVETTNYLFCSVSQKRGKDMKNEMDSPLIKILFGGISLFCLCFFFPGLSLVLGLCLVIGGLLVLFQFRGLVERVIKSVSDVVEWRAC